MSMMMPPDYAPGLPVPPGGGDPMMGGPAPPQDALSNAPLPSQDGMQGLLAALAGGGGGDMGGGLGGGLDPNAPPPPDIGQAPDDQGGGSPSGLDSIGHIQEAMKHLMMAMAIDQDETRGHGITKGMGALQAILAGHQKMQDQTAQARPTGG